MLDVDGKTYAGRLVRFGERVVTVRDDERHEIATGSVVAIEFPGHDRLERKPAPQVVLANGDRLALAAREIDEDALIARWIRYERWPPIKVPLETIQGLLPSAQSSLDKQDHLIGMLASAGSGSEDTLFLKNGDRLEGTLSGMTSGTFRIERAAGPLEVPADGVRLVRMSPELVSFPKPEGRTILLMLTDGSRLTFKDLRLDAHGMLSGTALFGAEVKVTLGAVKSVRFLGGNTVYLSDLEPSDYRFTPFLSKRWSYRRDANVLGGPLRVRGRECAKGIGLHSRAELDYRLDGKYRSFRASVGIDDSARGDGSVVFAVRLDGKTAWRSDTLTGRDAALDVPPVDVSGAEILTLVVEFGDLADSRDHADWCNPLLVR